MDSYNNSPKWYWKNRLHDAQILNLIQTELVDNYIKYHQFYNCFDIELDSSGALFETDIKKISLLNYKIKLNEIDTTKLPKIWWMHDTLTQLPNGRYQLDIKTTNLKNSEQHIIITFETAEIQKII